MTATRGERTVGLLIGGGLALLFVAMAAWSVAGWTLGTAKLNEHKVIHGPVRSLSIDGAQGDVVVRPGSGPDVTVDASARGSFHTPRMQVDVTGSRVQVRGGCRAFWLGHCSTRLVVHVPAGTPVHVSTGSGDLSASGLSGPVRLTTSSGDIDAGELSGPASLHTGSGDVTAHELSGTASLASSSGGIAATGLSAATVNATAGSGDVDLLFSAAPDSVNAETGSGDVALLVPRGGAYAVDAETSSGDRSVGVRTDPQADRILRARTGSGDVSVLYGGG